MNYLAEAIQRQQFFTRVSDLTSAPRDGSLYFLDIDVSKDVATQLLEHLPTTAIPILSHSANYHESLDGVEHYFRSAFSVCRSASFRAILLGIDNDTLVHQICSPRTNPVEIAQRMVGLHTIVELCADYFNCWGAALTVEELCPGGMDASQGIEIAQNIEKWGASLIIGSGGTRDFPALKWRRRPNIKNDPTRFISPESWLASAAWLVGKISLPILAEGECDDSITASRFAHTMGLQGIVVRHSE